MHADEPRPLDLADHRLRPKLGSAVSLSTLTQRANQTLELMQKPEEGTARLSSSGLLHSSRNKLPSDIDFKRAIDKLGRVYTQGGVETLKIKLQDGKSSEFMLEPDDKLYARLNLQGQLCPLVLTVARTRGRLVSYISRTVQEPLDINCDAKITGDRIWISDPGMRFRPGMLYICFAAVEETTFTITTQFGQKKRNAKDHWKSSQLSTFDEDWEKVFGASIDHRPKYEKDFIVKNLTVLGMNSPQLVTRHQQKTAVADGRRKQAVMRKKAGLDMKKRKALQQVNRQQLREIERDKQLLLQKERAALSTSAQKWITTIWVLSAAQHWSSLYSARKIKLEQGKKRLNAIVKIALAYRKHIMKSDKHQLALRRAVLSVRMGIRQLFLIDRQILKGNQMRVIRESWKIARLPALIGVFYRKGKGLCSCCDTKSVEICFKTQFHGFGTPDDAVE